MTPHNHKTGLLRTCIGGMLMFVIGVTANHPANAQPVPIRGQVISTSVNRTIITNNYLGMPYGYARPGFAYTCTGCFPGAGAYDSAIAVTGIAAGASVLNTLIGSMIQRQPQVIINQGNVGRAYPTSSGEWPAGAANPRSTPGCTSYTTGASTADGPVFVTVCR